MLTSWMVSVALATVAQPVQGSLSGPDGGPLQGTHTLTLAVYAAATGGSALWEEQDVIVAQDGAFATLLGDAPGFDPALFRTAADRWIEVRVDGGTASNRVAVGWSLRADWSASAGDAARLGGVDADAYARKTDPVAWSRLTEVPSVQLTTDGIAWSRITGVPELGRTYTNGAGITLSGTTFSLDSTAVEALARGVAYDSTAELDPIYARRDSANPIRLGATGASSCASDAYGTIRWTGSNFEGCTPQGWTVLGGASQSGSAGSAAGTGSQTNPGRTCRTIKYANPASASGLYWIDPELDGSPIQVQCDMTRAGGGWTLGLKTWYQSGMAGQQGAVGNVADATTLKGAGYKLSDDDIRDIIGPSNNFDVLGDQAGYNTSYSGGNYEYATITNYTGWWTYGSAVADSTSPYQMTAYRASDGAVAWSGVLACGPASGGIAASTWGINCFNVVSGNNPAGGAGCTVNMGSNHSSYHHFYMGEHNTDTYLYLCNGAQHSSGHNMNHRFWFRERYDPTVNSLGTQANPGRTCKAIKTAIPTAGDGVYWIDPESDGSPIQAQCDMTRAGGGWTLGLKVWYQSGLYGASAAAGTVADAMTLKGANYKLSDNDINDIIGASRNFDVLADQAGYNATYSGGNYEYVTLENYTATFTFAALVPESSTTTTMRSFRASTGQNLWTGRLVCGSGSVSTAARGINCVDVPSGVTNPAGGGGCATALGSAHASYHHFYMSESNTDTYLYMCNGAQHSSGHSMNHRFWFRERS